jgi:hypothetical protein
MASSKTAWRRWSASRSTAPLPRSVTNACCRQSGHKVAWAPTRRAASTRWPSIAAVDPVRSKSASSMRSAPATIAWIRVTLRPGARRLAFPRSTRGRRPLRSQSARRELRAVEARCWRPRDRRRNWRRAGRAVGGWHRERLRKFEPGRCRNRHSPCSQGLFSESNSTALIAATVGSRLRSSGRRVREGRSMSDKPQRRPPSGRPRRRW